MEPCSLGKRRGSDAESVASLASVSSEPAASRSRSTTPFTLRSQCAHHSSECPEGHGIDFRSRPSPSPKRSVKKKVLNMLAEKNGMASVRKKLLLGMDIIHEKPNGGTPHVTRTSDYSSADEGTGEMVNDEAPSTPVPQQPHRVFTPLPRSPEKTDYTYAKSYSYRTEVTPDRVITMPNMTRRSIDRSQGEKYSSPELKVSALRNSYLQKLSKATDIRASYGPDHVSDDDLEDTISYKLKSPPILPRAGSGVKFASAAYNKIVEAISNLTWWIYLVTCYSLVIDTHILQHRSIANLRNMCRNQLKNSRLYLMLFVLIPLCLCAGGLLYSAFHAFNTHSLDEPAIVVSNPSPSNQDLIPPVVPALVDDTDTLQRDKAQLKIIEVKELKVHQERMRALEQQLIQKKQEDDERATLSLVAMQKVEEELKMAQHSRQQVEEELKLSKDALALLQDKMDEINGRLAQLDTAYGSLNGQVLAAVTKDTKDCCDPDFLGSLVDAKIATLAAQMADASKKDSEVIAKAVQLLQETQKELDDWKDWRRSAEARGESLSEKLSQLHSEIEERNKRIVDQVAADVEAAIEKWDNKSKQAFFSQMKDELIVDISRQIKVLNAKSGRGLSKEEVQQMIHDALGTYDSDKTGRADYALEPAGGVVLSTRCTETLSSQRPRLSIWGFSLWSEPNNPRVVIQPGIVPGECWSFRGFDGYLVIQLSRRIVPTAFTLEHIPISLAPDGRIDSAPRNFTVYGLTKETDTAGVRLGQYVYDSAGEPLQTFPVQEENPGAFSIVELRIHSNHGHQNYTCLYRFRVHGQVVH